MKNRIHVTLSILLLLAGFIGWVGGRSFAAQPKQQEDKKTPTQMFMRAKLESAQQVLEGLAVEDFQLIKKGADRMQAMSKATEWHLIEGPIYAHHSAEFRRCCEDLAKRADQKNIDAAAMSYMQLTMACVSCHRYVRSTRVVQNNQPLPLENIKFAFLPPAAVRSEQVD